MRPVRLSSGDWSVSGFEAIGFFDRLRGTFAAPAGSVVVIATRSVHGFGLRSPLQLVAVDARMRVIALRRLAPNRLTLIRSAAMIIEIPEGEAMPALGTTIEMSRV